MIGLSLLDTTRLWAYPKSANVDRRSVDISGYPDLVMIMLGFQLNGWRGLIALRRIRRGLGKIIRDRPDGLLAHDDIRFSLTHFGSRQYWRDMDALERFTRAMPYADWWHRIREMSDGAGFWHETYHARGGVEAIYVAMPQAVGLHRFAPNRRPVGSVVTARAWIQRATVPQP